MKKTFLLLSALALSFVFSGPALCLGAEAPRSAEEENGRKIHDGLLLFPTELELDSFEKKHSWGFRRSRAELALDKALEDIAAHIPLLLLMRKDFGESFLDWAVPIAEKLPSQPVAVIQFVANLEDGYAGTGQRYIEHICPRAVIEDAIPFSEYKNWLERSSLVLEAFTMNDPKAERARSFCLEKIKEALATAKPWTPGSFE